MRLRICCVHDDGKNCWIVCLLEVDFYLILLLNFIKHITFVCLNTFTSSAGWTTQYNSIGDRGSMIHCYVRIGRE